MEKKRLDGFKYIYSESLKQEIAFSLKTGWVYCEDKYPNGELVSYSPRELEIVDMDGGTITPAIHNVKKLFGGSIVEYGNDQGTVDKRSEAPGANADRKSDNPGAVGKTPGPSGDGQEEREGGLDIF
jgi:hypothetical protein